MAIVEADVLGWWDFEEGSGTSVSDEIAASPANIDLVASPSWVTGGPTNLPNGVDLNGSGQYGNISKDYDFPSSEGTLSIWFNADTISGTQAVIGNGNLGGECDIFFFSGSLFGRSRFSSDRDVTTSVSASTLYLVTWAFKSGDMEMYVNGSSVGTNTGAGTLNDAGNNLVIGRRAGSSTLYFNGKIFQANLFNRRLTTAEVGELYNSGDGVTYSGLFSGGGGAVKPNYLGFSRL
jgi:hypothetical protein